MLGPCWLSQWLMPLSTGPTMDRTIGQICWTASCPCLSSPGNERSTVLRHSFLFKWADLAHYYPTRAATMSCPSTTIGGLVVFPYRHTVCNIPCKFPPCSFYDACTGNRIHSAEVDVPWLISFSYLLREWSSVRRVLESHKPRHASIRYNDPLGELIVEDAV